jgi:GTP cyclohydrolase I
MSTLENLKKHRADSFTITDDANDLPPSKRVRESAESDTSSVVAPDEDRLIRMAQAVKILIECMGEDTDREGLESTPMRAAKALQFFTKGYMQTPDEVVGEGIFNEKTNGDMVLVKNIDMHSLCEHHMVPFSGKVHIAYIPDGKILGLSKLARIADVFSRRLQVQERLTRQIAEAIMKLVSPKGVGVIIEATHMCMVMRGVERAGASTISSTMLGCFDSDRHIRNEFFGLVQNGSR